MHYLERRCGKPTRKSRHGSRLTKLAAGMIWFPLAQTETAPMHLTAAGAPPAGNPCGPTDAQEVRFCSGGEWSFYPSRQLQRTFTENIADLLVFDYFGKYDHRTA